MAQRRAPKANKIQIGNKSLNYGKQVGDMIDSNDLYNQKDFVALREKLEKEGYLFIRDVIPRDIIINARNHMLNQALKDESIMINDTSSLSDARIRKNGKKWCDGYCIDGITGSEVHGRPNIDIDAWEKIGPSKTCQLVYNGNHIQHFWKLLFGEKFTKPLVKQTFLRLMGNSGTIQHADYYYFKRDTNIFSSKDGLDSQNAAKQYITEQNMWHLYDMKEDQYEQRDKDINSVKYDLICDICSDRYCKEELDEKRRNRLDTASKKRNDFGMEGAWHCPRCAVLPLSIYTTWISLSNLNAPKDSILAVIPESHKLKLWDLPKKDAQVPGDFNWKLKWVIPKSVGYGDIIIFNIKTVHAVSLNTSSPRTYRCSFDTRLQLVPCI